MKELFLLLWILFLCADKVNTAKQDIDPLAPYINYQMNNLCLECLANKGLCKEGVQMLLEKGYAIEREVEIACANEREDKDNGEWDGRWFSYICY